MLEKIVLSWALAGTGSVLFIRQVAVQPTCRCTVHVRTCALPLFVWRVHVETLEVLRGLFIIFISVILDIL